MSYSSPGPMPLIGEPDHFLMDLSPEGIDLVGDFSFGEADFFQRPRQGVSHLAFVVFGMAISSFSQHFLSDISDFPNAVSQGKDDENDRWLPSKERQIGVNHFRYPRVVYLYVYSIQD